MKTTVKDVMTTRVIWVRKDATFREMAAALRKNRVSAFPVLGDEDKVIGVVSEADMLAKEALDSEPGVIAGLLHHRDQKKARGVTAGDLMTAAVVACARRTRLSTPPGSCTSARSSDCPVIDGNGHLVGIISRADVLAVFDRTDGAIRKEINGVLRRDARGRPADLRRDGQRRRGDPGGRARQRASSATKSCGGSGTSRAWWRSATASATRLPSMTATSSTSWLTSRWTRARFL